METVTDEKLEKLYRWCADCPGPRGMEVREVIRELQRFRTRAAQPVAGLDLEGLEALAKDMEDSVELWHRAYILCDLAAALQAGAEVARWWDDTEGYAVCVDGPGTYVVLPLPETTDEGVKDDG